TTSPQMSMRSNMPRMASQAAASALSLSPLPIHCMQLSAAISVARRKSNSTRRWMSNVMNFSFLGSLLARLSVEIPLRSLFRKQPYNRRVRAPDLRRRLSVFVASVAVGAVRQQPLYRFCIALPREVHQQSTLPLIARIDVGSLCSQQFHHGDRIGLRACLRQM